VSYESKCIRDIILDNINKDTFLPAIQREYVWPPRAVEKLFDSIMGDFPISSFLFWKVKEEKKKQWIAYEFIKDFDQEDPHNEEADLSGVNKDIFLVLDGQQRLTSIYVGLKGSYSFFYYRQRETRLYLNLAKKPIANEDDPEELVYQFAFLEGKPSNDQTHIWYRVGNILDFYDAEDAKESIASTITSYSDEIILNAKKLVGHLHSRIHTFKMINYYEEKSQDYDKVVEVFIRANTGGRKLTYSDILLSTATAKWKNLNAREELNSFTDEINRIGDGYSFDKDFVMKGALFLTEGLPIQYKVKNFTKQNLEKIENNWPSITSAISQAVLLINRFGFTRGNITSNAALLPISLFIRLLQKSNYHKSTAKEDVENQVKIQIWLILSLVKGGFGGSSDTTLKKTREVIEANIRKSEFPIDDLNRVLVQEPNFSELEIENLLKTGYKTQYSYLILSILYPDRDWKDNIYHEDHIYPKSEFTIAKLRQRGYSKDRVDAYMAAFKTVGNLQLLTDTENIQKNATDFSQWLANRDSNFMKRHHIPKISDYSFDNFIEFFDERKKLIENKLRRIKII